jgi:hypothetical protein
LRTTLKMVIESMVKPGSGERQPSLRGLSSLSVKHASAQAPRQLSIRPAGS